MRKLSGKEKAELEAEIRKTRAERVQRIVEKSNRKPWRVLLEALIGWL